MDKYNILIHFFGVKTTINELKEKFGFLVSGDITFENLKASFENVYDHLLLIHVDEKGFVIQSHQSHYETSSDLCFIVLNKYHDSFTWRDKIGLFFIGFCEKHKFDINFYRMGYRLGLNDNQKMSEFLRN